MGPVRQNPMHRTVRTAHLSVLMTVHNFQHTIQHRTVLIISPLTSRQSSQLSCCLSEEKGAIAHIGVARILPGGALFFAKNLMTFFYSSRSLTWSYSTALQLPPTTSLSHLRGFEGVHLTKFSPIFASFQERCLEKFFSSPWRVQLHLLRSAHPPPRLRSLAVAGPPVWNSLPTQLREQTLHLDNFEHSKCSSGH